MHDFISNSEINSLGTLNVTFPFLSHAQMNLYYTSDKQGWQKIDSLLQQFDLLHNGKQINKRLVFWCYPLYFA